MSILREKSIENIDAANLLMVNKMFMASIHCFYYAVFQMSKYILANYCNIGYEEQEKNSKGIDSHHYVSSTMGNRLEELNKFYMVDYNRSYSILKMLRKKADYSMNIVDEQDAQKARKASECIINLLTKYK